MKNNNISKHLTTLIIILSITFSVFPQNDSCFGEKRELKIGSLMPYTKVKVGNAEGYFLIDFGTTGSTIDLKGFISGSPTASGQPNQFSNFEFFSVFNTVNLSVQDHSNIKLGNMKQAGILGTDFLSLNIFTLDYTNKTVYKASSNFCTDSSLRNNGFKAVSTIGYYSNNLSKLNNTCTPNIPTIPIKIGKTMAVAQIDPGFDDNLYPHSININQSLYDSIIDSGIVLLENNSANSTLSTCVSGVSENVKAYKLPTGTSFAIIGVDGDPVVVRSDVHIFLKQTPLQAKSCGGIGTWQIPAAQIGASFLIDSKKIVFDPYKSKVWFYSR